MSTLYRQYLPLKLKDILNFFEWMSYKNCSKKMILISKNKELARRILNGEHGQVCSKLTLMFIKELYSRVLNFAWLIFAKTFFRGSLISRFFENCEN